MLLSAQSLSGPLDTTVTASPGAAQLLTISVEVSYLPGEAAAVVPAPPRADGAGGHHAACLCRAPLGVGISALMCQPELPTLRCFGQAILGYALPKLLRVPRFCFL